MTRYCTWPSQRRPQFVSCVFAEFCLWPERWSPEIKNHLWLKLTVKKPPIHARESANQAHHNSRTLGWNTTYLRSAMGARLTLLYWSIRKSGWRRKKAHTPTWTQTKIIYNIKKSTDKLWFKKKNSSSFTQHSIYSMLEMNIPNCCSVQMTKSAY